jgi:hypothetical protein
MWIVGAFAGLDAEIAADASTPITPADTIAASATP